MKSVIPIFLIQIFLLPLLSKVFERIIYGRIIKHVENFELLNANRFSFRSKLSTINTARRLTELMRNMKNDENYAIVVLLDFQKTFDRVGHVILLDKLENYGICYNLQNSFLEKHTSI